MSVWAKSQPLHSPEPWVTIEEHLSDVRRAAYRLLTPARLQAFGRLGVSPERALQLVEGAAWLHDWGKATQQWQDDINARKQRLPQHALSSFLACRWVLNQKLEELPPDLLAMSLAVLAHHGQMHRGSFDGDADLFRHQLVSPHLDLWRELARELPFDTAPGNLNAPFEAARICTMVDAAKTRVGDLARQAPFRGLFCLLLSILVEADHAASGRYSPLSRPLFAPRMPGTPTEFQNEVHVHPADILCAMAGCGAGKTAAALLRASDLAQQHHVDRIVLCLPTRFTSNSLLRDMSDASKYFYPRSIVGLVHSEALMVLRENIDESDERDFPGTPEERHGRSVRYEHPITISTVDHLLMSLYHGYRFADRAFGNLLSSLVVLDEVHAYDATTLSAIRDGMEILARHGVPVLVMSATLPASRRRFIGAGETNTVIESANQFRPFITRCLPEPLTNGRGIATQASPAAKKYLEESTHLKLAVYVNQVERAKALARAAREWWSPESIFCYHSELAPRDRVALEEKIIAAFREDRPVCLVATQAAELSLDISAERMVTELASADILVQRAGRLNRRGLHPQAHNHSRLPDDFEFSLFLAPLWRTEDAEKERGGAALPYKDLAILERTWNNAPWDEVFSFERGIAWCEIALPEEPLYRDGGLHQASWNDAAFGKKPQENFNGDNRDGVEIRDIDEATRGVLPQQHYETLKNLELEKPLTRQEIAQIEVPLRAKKFWALRKMTTPIEFEIVIRQKNSKIDKVPFIAHLMNVDYDPNSGGFDFHLLSDDSIAHEERGEIL